MIFLNSLQWRKFQKSVGRKLFIFDDGYLVKLDIPFGKSYLYSNSPHALKYLDEIKEIGRAEGAIFFKWEPMTRLQREIPISKSQFPNKSQILIIKQLQKAGFILSTKELQPQETIVLDLKKSEEELLRQMEQKTRYNLRLAQKRGVKVFLSDNKKEDFKKLWKIFTDTSRRDKFNLHSRDYYEKLLDMDMARLYITRKDNDIASLAIIIFDNHTATYLHGASDYLLRKHMAPYLMHWKIMQDAKKEGLGHYDLWGIDEKKWPGVTRFKKGFGGEEIKYPGSFDLPLNKFWYILYKAKNAL
ncbi:MAG: hypothetical protein A2919_00790 [Candidatus Spechtbacteria bacterium RIFCSPLOWO2_01_FULL_43_12]|uniref:BioF2-like acetyltransferase domain-containing protein n=1 Tax=Candidatus Spechtbacteria bacterium RIFCSPLOWO2_01_FULL_43_12 TaxID=1802162 RepID=A0A1G2HFI3_9BACT|nr:MAG: hypothetical protein A2919_00790 [Candidatus Spechtbacteria bacterium RIFCSPLOWO2_01_FULL_43_12]